MAKFCGGDFRTQVKVSGSWVNLASRGDTLTIDAEIVGITHKGDVWRNVQPACGTMSGSISVNGFMTDGSALAYIQQRVFQRLSVELQVVSGNGDSFYCEQAYLTARERAGDFSGAETISLTFATGTDVVYTAASPPTPPGPSIPVFLSLDGTQPGLNRVGYINNAMDQFSATVWVRCNNPSAPSQAFQRLFAWAYGSSFSYVYSSIAFMWSGLSRHHLRLTRVPASFGTRVLRFDFPSGIDLMDGEWHNIGYSIRGSLGATIETLTIDGEDCIFVQQDSGPAYEEGIGYRFSHSFLYLFRGSSTTGDQPQNWDFADLKIWNCNQSAESLAEQQEYNMSGNDILVDSWDGSRTGVNPSWRYLFDEGTGNFAYSTESGPPAPNQTTDLDIQSSAYWGTE